MSDFKKLTEGEMHICSSAHVHTVIIMLAGQLFHLLSVRRKNASLFAPSPFHIRLLFFFQSAQFVQTAPFPVDGGKNILSPRSFNSDLARWQYQFQTRMPACSSAP